MLRGTYLRMSVGLNHMLKQITTCLVFPFQTLALCCGQWESKSQCEGSKYARVVLFNEGTQRARKGNADLFKC